MNKKVLVLSYTKLRMIYEKNDGDNYLSQSEEILQTERCMEDGRFLDTVILTKTNLPRTNLPFSMDAFVKDIESDLIEASTKLNTRTFYFCQTSTENVFV